MKALHNLPSFLMVVALTAASYALAGRFDEARQAITELRRLNSNFHTSNLTDWVPIRQPQHIAIFADGLRKAGLPE